MTSLASFIASHINRARNSVRADNVFSPSLRSCSASRHGAALIPVVLCSKPAARVRQLASAAVDLATEFATLRSRSGIGVRARVGACRSGCTHCFGIGQHRRIFFATPFCAGGRSKVVTMRNPGIERALKAELPRFLSPSEGVLVISRASIRIR